MRVILLLSLLLAIGQVRCNDTLLRVLLSGRTKLFTQMEQQIAQARSLIGATTSGELNKFIADIQEAHKFALDETRSYAKYLEGYSEACLANAPNTMDEILQVADNFLNDCVSSVIAEGEEIEKRFQDALEDYRGQAVDLNLVFARNYFKNPEKVFTVELFSGLYETNTESAIQWDNVGSMQLYGMRQEPKADLELLNDKLYKCIMDMKEHVATEIGRNFLYFWDPVC